MTWAAGNRGDAETQGSRGKMNVGQQARSVLGTRGDSEESRTAARFLALGSVGDIPCQEKG